MGRKAELSVLDAARLCHKTPQYIRMGLQQQRLPYGDAVQNKNGRWSYNIYPKKFYEYTEVEQE